MHLQVLGHNSQMTELEGPQQFGPNSGFHANKPGPLGPRDQQA